jgi:hypothetical protein
VSLEIARCVLGVVRSPWHRETWSRVAGTWQGVVRTMRNGRSIPPLPQSHAAAPRPEVSEMGLASESSHDAGGCREDESTVERTGWRRRS